MKIHLATCVRFVLTADWISVRGRKRTIRCLTTTKLNKMKALFELQQQGKTCRTCAFRFRAQCNSRTLTKRCK